MEKIKEGKSLEIPQGELFTISQLCKEYPDTKSLFDYLKTNNLSAVYKPGGCLKVFKD